MDRKLIKGIFIMLLSSISTCSGQLMWKLASVQDSLIFLMLGFLLYGVGALCMIVALKFGDLSVLHPMLSFGFVLSIFLSVWVLQESVTFNKVIGMTFIIAGIVFLGKSSITKEKKE